MQGQGKAKRNGKWLLAMVFVVTVAFSFALRVVIIRATPQHDGMIDLEIYMMAGALIRAGIDPFNYSEGTVLREQLRARATSPWLESDQGRWNRYVSAFLPCVPLVMAMIGRVSEDARTFRLAFAIGDALACGMAAVVLAIAHGRRRAWRAYGTGLLVGACSPFFLYYGTVIPEPKGTQIFLMISVIALLHQSGGWSRYVLTALVSGLAVSFYGLGMVFVPVALWRMLRRSDDIIWDVSLCGVMFTIATATWLLPFDGNYVEVVLQRLSEGRYLQQPNHANIWRVVMAAFPAHWRLLRTASIVSYAALVLTGLARKKLDGVSAACLAIFVYVCVVISGGMGGAMDRANIGVTMGIVGMALSNLTLGWVLACAYAVLGALRVTAGQEILAQLRAWGIAAATDLAFVDGICVTVMVVLIFSHLLIMMLTKGNVKCDGMCEY